MGRLAGKKQINYESENRIRWARVLWPHFKQEGLKSFNMDEVAKTLGKSKATVYKYFHGRGDILEVILSQVLGELVSFEGALTDRSDSYEKRYLKAIDILSDSLEGVSSRFLFDLKKYHPEIWASIEEFKSFAIKVLEKFYKEGLEKGYLRKTKLSLLVLGDEIFLSSLLEPELLLDKNIFLEEGLSAYFENKMFGMLIR